MFMRTAWSYGHRVLMMNFYARVLIFNCQMEQKRGKIAASQTKTRRAQAEKTKMIFRAMKLCNEWITESEHVYI